VSCNFIISKHNLYLLTVHTLTASCDVQ